MKIVSMNLSVFIVLVVLVNAVKATESNTIYIKVGDQLSIKAGITTPVNQIGWKYNGNKVAEWDKHFNTFVYGEYTKRTTFDNVTGNILIRDMQPSDSGTFQLELNSTLHKSFPIFVINEVPTPTISSSCDAAMTSCSLTCMGGVTDAGTVTYYWNADGAKLNVSTEMLTITKNEVENTKEFTCMMENGVSQKESAPYSNLLNPNNVNPFPQRTLIGISLFILLITGIVVFVFIHKYKSGVWFYETESMPWEAGFWRKQRNSGDLASSPNGDSVMTPINTEAAENGVSEEPKEEDKLKP